MYDIKKLFEKNELAPAIVQDAATKDVLMLAYMNEESLRMTLKTGATWFYSRSRGELWRKGETSGNTQRVLSVVPDCDNDALLVTVEQTGVACHTGNWSCFFADPIETGEGA
jgi:phosphoribosyl-AMP cyclohydrolase